MAHPGSLATEAEAGPGLCLRAAGSRDAAALARLLTDAFDERWDVARVDRDLLTAPDVVRTWIVEGNESGDRLHATASERLLPDEYPGAGYLHWVGTSHQARVYFKLGFIPEYRGDKERLAWSTMLPQLVGGWRPSAAAKSNRAE